MPSKLSIIIVAHDRRNFIRYAIESALNQSISREKYEVIVVKNFSSEEYDKTVQKMGVKIIMTDEASLGSKLVLGIGRSEGEVLSFLEDDDEFEMDKVERVLDFFSRGRVAYYHNNYSVIAENGTATRGALPYSNKKNEKKFNIETEELKTETINKAVKNGAPFNLSCISIEKTIVAGKLDKLYNRNGAIDYFMFYSALDSGMEIVIDNSLLTKYRVHPSNNSLVLTPDRKAFSLKKIEFFKDDLFTLQIIQSMVKKKVVSDYIACRTLVPLLALSMLGLKDEKGKKGVTKIIRCIIKTRSEQVFALLTLNLVSKIFPHFGIWFYFNYESRKLRKLVGWI